MPPRGIVYVVVLLSLLATGIVIAAPPDFDPYAAILYDNHIDPTPRDINRYLSRLKPTSQVLQTISQKITQLGSSDSDLREAATRELVAMPVVPVDLLLAAADSEDNETRLRAQQVLATRSTGNTTSSVVVACMRTIVRRKITGQSQLIFDLLPLYGDEFVLTAARQALCVTSTPEDLPRIRQIIAARHTESRVAAIGALASLLTGQPPTDLQSLLNDPTPRVQLAAARALADRGDRACLATLVSLLSADDIRVRHASSTTLRALTGKSSDYVPWLEPAAQRPAIAFWQQWLEKESAAAKLTYPLKPADFEIGRTLICLYAKNEVTELDATGRQTFNISEPNACPWACQGLPNGGRLIALYNTNTLVEYRPDGKERIRIAVPSGPMSVQRLENGNTLLACNNAQKVAEVDDQGKVIWELAFPGGPCDAQRLENGHTLVTLQNTNTVVEVDSTGKEIWKVEGLHTPRTATRLENGNTLVCDLGSGKIVEYDREAKEVWSQGGFASPFGAQRLSTGTTLVSDAQSIKEIDQSGKVISENKMPSLGRIHRY